MGKISFIKSDDRKYNIERCLSLIKSEIMAGLKNAKNVVIKPNCIVENGKLAVTSVEALDAVLEFIKPYVKGQITLAEGTGIGNTLTAFQNYDYFSLHEKYDLELVDLNEDEFETIELIDKNGKPWQAQVAKTILNSDYLISVSPMKTHNEVVYTGAIKNVAVGSLVRSIPTFSKTINKLKESMGMPRNNKALIHQGTKAINHNIKTLSERLPLNLAVIDAYESMEGNGPVSGDLVATHFALASSDSLGADWLACLLMGIDIKDVPYLSMLIGENDNFESNYFVIGDEWKTQITKFKMHPNFEKMKKLQ